MPLFSRSSFRTPKKPPRRKADSLPNIANLDDSLNFTSDSISLAPGAAPAVSMKLGAQEIFFENGEWVSSKLAKYFELTDCVYVLCVRHNVAYSETVRIEIAILENNTFHAIIIIQTATAC